MDTKPSFEEQTKFYDEWNTNYRDTDFENIEPESYVRGSRVLKELQDLGVKNARILEVGCGTGWLSEKLCESGKVDAVDLSPKAIEIAKRRNPQVQYIAGDFMTQVFQGAPYDVVICIETLFYVSDQGQFLKKIANLIKPGGYLILTAVNKFVYERRSDIDLSLKKGQLRNWLSRTDLQRLMSHQFDLQKSTTILPKGDKGILRVFNSYKLNRLFETLAMKSFIDQAKEKIGLGHSLLIVGRKR